MHIQLRKAAIDKILVAAGKTGRSPNELTNLILEHVDILEIAEMIKVTVKVETDKGPKAKVFKRTTRYIVDL